MDNGLKIARTRVMIDELQAERKAQMAEGNLLQADMISLRIDGLRDDIAELEEAALVAAR